MQNIIKLYVVGIVQCVVCCKTNFYCVLCIFSDDSSSESGSGNGIHTLTPPSVGAAGVSDSTGTGPGSGSYAEVNGNGTAAPLDFSTTSSSSSSEDQQPVNLSDRLSQALPSAAAMLATFNPEQAEVLRRKYPKSSELRLDRDIRDFNNKVLHSFRTKIGKC